MLVTCLNEQEKSDVVDRFINKEESQTDIAMAYSLSRRTIQRVLQERGVLASREVFECSGNDKSLLAVVKEKHQIPDAFTLDKALSAPVLSHANVLVYLCNMNEYAFSNAMKAIQQARAIIYKEAMNA